MENSAHTGFPNLTNTSLGKMAAAGDRQIPLEEEDEAEIHVDVLETVFSHVPLVHLASASHVSRSWLAAVQSSLRHRNKPKPWLILHIQSTRFPYPVTTRAYDPRSDMWIRISQPSMKHNSSLRSSNSNLLYMLSPSKFSFSFGQLKFNWCHVDPPKVWRMDPIVARVGDHVVIAGCACDFEDNHLAVEIYSLKTSAWGMGESMPEKLKDSANSACLSIATTNEKLIVTVKQSGVTHWFDPEMRSWSESIVLDPGQPVSSYHIGCSNDGLILIGVSEIRDIEVVKVWRVNGENFQSEEIGEMPMEYMEELKSESWGFASMEIRAAGNFVYVYNTWEVEKVVACELMDDGGCRWWVVRNAVARDELISKRVVYACAEVGINELSQVTRAGIGIRVELLDSGTCSRG